MISLNIVNMCSSEFLGNLIITLGNKLKNYFNIRLYFIFFSNKG